MERLRITGGRVLLRSDGEQDVDLLLEDGRIGQKLLNGGEVATILIVFLLLVQLADAISAHLRKQLA